MVQRHCQIIQLLTPKKQKKLLKNFKIKAEKILTQPLEIIIVLIIIVRIPRRGVDKTICACDCVCARSTSLLVKQSASVLTAMSHSAPSVLGGPSGENSRLTPRVRAASRRSQPRQGLAWIVFRESRGARKFLKVTPSAVARRRQILSPSVCH